MTRHRSTTDSGRWPQLTAAVALALAIAVSGVVFAAQRAMSAALEAGRITPRIGEDTPATAMDLSVGAGNTSPAIVADPRQPQFAVMASRVEIPDFSCALELSGDGGRSWISANPVTHLPAGADKCYAPEAAFDRQGRLYYLFVGLAGAGNQPMGVYLTTSTDHGATFGDPKMILGPANFSVRMLIDPTVGVVGRIHLVWLHAGEPPPLGGFPTTPNPILSSYSDDMGATFTTPVQVNANDQRRVLAPALALGPHHHVHVAYYDLLDDARDYQGLEGPVWDGTWALDVATSSDGGRTFGKREVVSADLVPSERIMLVFTMPPPALVAWSSHVCLAWSDSRNGDPDVFTRCSTGGRWSPLVRVNRDGIGNGHRQYLPRLGVSPGGRLDIVYLDRPDALGRYNQTTYTYSTNGGRSFHPPIAISAHVSDTRIGAQYGVVSAAGQVEFGSRLGLLSLRNSVVAAWPDTRNSTLSSTSQDIFTATVQLSSRSFWWSNGVLAPVAGLVIALGFVAVRRRSGHRRGHRTDDSAPPSTAGDGDHKPELPQDSAIGVPGT